MNPYSSLLQTVVQPKSICLFSPNVISPSSNNYILSSLTQTQTQTQTQTHTHTHTHTHTEGERKTNKFQGSVTSFRVVVGFVIVTTFPNYKS